MTVKEIVSRLSLKEKILLMSPNMSWLELIWQALILRHFNNKPVRAGGNKRFGVPEIRFCDGPRGLVCYRATCFPVSIARAASFDPEMEEQIGNAIAKETRAIGGNFFGGVCVNVPHHPGWGRSQESYGEDPFLSGVFGSALVRGISRHNVVACVKHFALNSIENTRFRVDVNCSERTLREVYLPHFKKCVEAGAGSVMGAYNKFRGEHCCHNEYLLTHILRDEWGFGGFTMSDFLWGIRDTEKAAVAGMDVEMPLPRYFGRKLLRAVRRGRVSPEIIDRAAERIAGTMLAAKNAPDPLDSYPPSLVGHKDHIALSAKAAAKAMTLIKNDSNTLPMDACLVKKLAVFGKLAEAENLGDRGSSRVYPPYAVTVLEGLKNLGGRDIEVVYARGDNASECRRIAGRCDAVLFVVGCDYNDEGEYIKYVTAKTGGDRKNLSLKPDEINLIKTAGPANPNSAVVLIGGGTLLVEEWQNCVSAILLAFYPGMEGGNVIAKTLFGSINPGGKLPFVLPRQEEDLPFFDSNANEAVYGYLHGYTKLESEGVEPSYYFGHGLSYSEFTISNIEFYATPEEFIAGCTVENTSRRTGDEVIQLYIGFDNSRVQRPVKLLRGFKRITLKPREKQAVTLRCPKREIAWYNQETASWEVEKMDYQIYIGTSSDPKELFSGVCRV